MSVTDTPPPAKIGVMLATPVRKFNGMQDFHPLMKVTLNKLATMSSDPACPYEFQIAIMEGGLVRARNHIVHEFKKQAAKTPNLKWLVTMDDDIECDDQDILRLLSHRRPICGALYTTREQHCHWIANFMHEVEIQPNGLLQVIESGTGLKCFHLQVFTEVERCLPNLVYTDRDSGERITAYFQHCVLNTDLKPDGDMLTEDFFFDHVCRMLKLGIFVDTKLKLKHRGGDGTLYPTGDWPPIPVDQPAP